MRLTIYQIDAFASKPFQGNPAAICPLQSWLPDELMQSIAKENNLSETAFFVPTKEGFHIRWFTPSHEVKLCGHATLASAYVLFEILNYEKETIRFDSRSGILNVGRSDGWLDMDFPAQPAVRCDVPRPITEAFASEPIACLKSEDYIVIFENEREVADADPDFERLRELDLRGVIITARSKQYDFVNRFFAPKYAIQEDPVTGSAFTQLIPYWASMLAKSELFAKQISPRGGEVKCRNLGDRVMISGQAVKFLVGSIEVEW